MIVRKKNGLFLRFFCFILFLFFTFYNFAYSDPISEIRVEGIRSIEEEAVLSAISLRVGLPLDPETVKKDIKSLYKTGFFQNIIFDRIKDQDKNILVIRVEEKPSIRSVSFLGANAVTESALLEKITSKKYTIIDERKLLTDVKTIKQEFIEKGYYLASVEYQLKEESEGTVEVVFVINQQNPVHVRSISIIGLDYFSAAELKENFATRTPSWLSLLTNEGTFKEEFVQRDQQFLNYYYRDHGFAEVDVGEPIASLDSSQENIDVTFRVEEGAQYRLGSVVVTGDSIETLEPKIKEELRLKVGKIFRISELSHDLTKLQQLYGDEGYPFVYVEPMQYLDRSNKLANIEFNIKRGEKGYFGTIHIEGNTKTFDNVIRRELAISEGELFNYTNLEKSQRNLERLGYFESVGVVKDLDEEKKLVNVRVIVKERATGMLNGSLGTSPGPDNTSWRLVGQGTYSDTNMFGRGYSTTANVNLTPAPKGVNRALNYSLGLGFSNPHVLDSQWESGLNLQYSLQDNAIHDNKDLVVSQTSISAQTFVGRDIIEDLKLAILAGVSIVHTKPINPIINEFFEHGITETLSQRLTYDKTDSFHMPTEGLYASVQNVFGVHVIKGDYYFGKVTSIASYYLPLYYTDTFKTNFRFTIKPGFVYELKDKPVPVWQRFSLGDFYTMKAWAYERSIGPIKKVLLSPLTGSVVPYTYGGDKMIYSSAEYFIPILPEANIRLVTFIEAGAVFAENDKFSLDKFKYDVGFGFRWTTALGQFRFEWAWQLDAKRGIHTPEFIFSVGPDNMNAL